MSSARRQLGGAADGSLRRLGDYSSAGWSPHGLFVVAARGGASTPWSPTGRCAGRSSVRGRWATRRGRPGTATGWPTSRAASCACSPAAGGRSPRGRGVAPVTPAWRPGAGYVLSYVTGRPTSSPGTWYTGRVLWTARPTAGRATLEWTDAATASWRSRRAGSAPTGRRRRGPERRALPRLRGELVMAVHRRVAAWRWPGRRPEWWASHSPRAGGAAKAVRRRGAVLRPRLVAERPLAAGRLARRRPVGLHRLAGRTPRRRRARAGW